ncbi:MAG TPA: hypothetical protein VHE78_04975 [Gemmatimonadaceae bacterium]|nr:hypothetical protein [Gemmatimonadaceae bacterium]
MTRRLTTSLLGGALFAFASAAAAQIAPPNIKRPIEAARKAAGATSAQIESAQQAGTDPRQGQLPAAAAQAGVQNVPSTPQEAAAMRAAKEQQAAQQRAAAADSASRRGSAHQSGAKGAMIVYREEFSYAENGRRDPFISLMASGELKPLLADLALIGVLYDEAQPGRSLAVLVDGSSSETYRVKAGNTLGRMRVVKVGQKDITFSLDEFGFSRQETLLLDMTPRKAGAAPGRRPQ